MEPSWQEMATFFNDLNAYLDIREQSNGLKARDIIIDREDCDVSKEEINLLPFIVFYLYSHFTNLPQNTHLAAPDGALQ